jgi:hypothetical protein
MLSDRITRFFGIVLSVCLAFAACKKSSRLAAPAGQEVAKATPAPSATPVPEPINLKSEVTVLCYLRFEDKPKDALAIKPADFEAKMQAHKDSGITVSRILLLVCPAIIPSARSARSSGLCQRASLQHGHIGPNIHSDMLCDISSKKK